MFFTSSLQISCFPNFRQIRKSRERVGNPNIICNILGHPKSLHHFFFSSRNHLRDITDIWMWSSCNTCQYCWFPAPPCWLMFTGSTPAPEHLCLLLRKSPQWTNPCLVAISLALLQLAAIASLVCLQQLLALQHYLFHVPNMWSIWMPSLLFEQLSWPLQYIL